MLKRQLRRRCFLSRVLPAALLAALATSCDLSPQVGVPTLPLPPPTVTRAGLRYNFTGTVPVAEANVLARNERTRLIFGERTTDHLYSFPVEAEAGDFFTMWYTVGLQQSAPILVEIPDFDAPDPDAPDAGAP